MRKVLPLLVLVPALLLSGCAASPEPTASSPAVETPAAEPSESPTPSPAETATPEPSASVPPAAGAITPEVAYDLCIRKISEGGYLAAGDPANVTFAPFPESVSVTRDDGYVGIYIEVTDRNNANQPESALECVVGGTAENPDWYTYGLGTRADSREQIEANLRAEHSA